MQLSLLISMSSLMLGGVEEDPLPTASMSRAIIEPAEQNVRHVDGTMAWLWASRHPHTQNKLSNPSRQPNLFWQFCKLEHAAYW